MAFVQRSVAIPEPTNEPDALWRTTQALKEAVEMLQGDRGSRAAALSTDVDALINDLQIQIDNISITASSGVDSFNSRTGIVVPQLSDYDSFFLTPAEGDAAYEDALGNPASDGYHLISTAAGARSWAAPPTSDAEGKISLYDEFTFDNGLSGPPDAGAFGTDDNPPINTVLYFDDTGGSGRNFGLIADQIDVGDHIVMAQTGATFWSEYVVDGAPVDETGWWTIPVAHHSGSTALPANGTVTNFTIFKQEGGAVPTPVS